MTSRHFRNVFEICLYRLGSKLSRYLGCSGRGGDALGWAACQDDLRVAQRAIVAGVRIGPVFKPYYEFMLEADRQWLNEDDRKEVQFPRGTILISDKYKDKATTLMLATRHSNLAMARLLINAGTDVSFEPCCGRTKGRCH